MIENKAYLSLKPEFKPYVKTILIKLEEMGYTPIVVEGLRTLAQQKEKVKLGYSKTLKSYHLSGLAADICDSREMWNKGLVRKFWYDMYTIIKSVVPEKGRLRPGLVWDQDAEARIKIYKKALDDCLAGKITQKEADAKIGWFCDAAHVEMRQK